MEEPPRWRARDIAYVFLLSLLVAGVLSIPFLIAGDIAAMRGERAKDTILVWSLLLDPLITAGICLWWVRRRYGVPLTEIGLRVVAPRRNILIGIASVPVLAFAASLVAMGLEAGGLTVPEHPVHRLIPPGAGLTTIGVVVFAGGVLAPVSEEIYCRGLAFEVLKRRLGVIAAVLISSAIFAAFHVYPAYAISVFGVGLGLAVLRHKTGSLTAPITAHCCYNLTGILLMMRS